MVAEMQSLCHICSSSGRHPRYRRWCHGSDTFRLIHKKFSWTTQTIQHTSCVARIVMTILLVLHCAALGECYIRGGSGDPLNLKEHHRTHSPTPALTPQFDPTQSGNVTALADKTALLNCRVHNAENLSVGAEAMSVGAGAMSVGAEAMSVGAGAMSVGAGAMLVGAGAMLVGAGAMSLDSRAMMRVLMQCR
ncbi:hypothetical protein FHG87_012490 [Trinorchestia longiramus]|nr:hypothetical protein FHG87_012490 [Trinorchestia longiramus]